MKILVIDDNPINRTAAEKQLGNEHELTVVGTYDEGRTLLGYERYDCRSNKHDFDVVLVDLLMPPSMQMQTTQSRTQTWGEMPVGIFLALLAAKNGAKYVGILTDDHHSHPASACFDAFNGDHGLPTVFSVENAKVVLCNDPNLMEDDESVKPIEIVRSYDDGTDDTYTEKQYPRFKKWDKFLKYYVLGGAK